jgi:hypothetical protein
LGRGLRTVVTAFVLAAGSWGYARLIQPWVTLPAADPQPTVAIDRPLEPLGGDGERIARVFLSDQTWAQQARYSLRSKDAYVYTNDWQPDAADGRVRLKPFAMVWVSRNAAGEEQATTLVGESAVVKFAGQLELMNSDPGRVISAGLEGRAQVRGPDGLMLDGKGFRFSEQALRLWSDYKVSFEYSGSKGNADGFQADLIPQSGPPSADRPHIFGVRNMQLSRNVVLELAVEKDPTAPPLQVRCAGSLTYDLIQQEAVLVDNVVAVRELDLGQREWLECDRLKLTFDSDPQKAGVPSPERRDEPSTARGQHQYQRINSQLRLNRVEASIDAARIAVGAKKRQVQLTSQRAKLTAWTEKLTYYINEERLDLQDSGQVVIRLRQTRSDTGSESGSETQLTVPRVILAFDRLQKKLKSTQCLGAGSMVSRNAVTKDVLFAASWKRALFQQHHEPTGLEVLELQENASIRQPARDLALGADVVRAWVAVPYDGSSFQAVAGVRSNDQTDAIAESSSSAADRGGDSAPSVQLRQLSAEGQVALLSPQLQLRRCESLHVQIEPPMPDADPVPDLQLAGFTASLTGNASSAPAAETADGANGAVDATAESHRRAETDITLPILAEARKIKLRFRERAPGTEHDGEASAATPSRIKSTANRKEMRSPETRSAEASSSTEPSSPSLPTLDLLEVDLQESVLVERPQPQLDDTLTISGDRLHAVNESRVKQIVHLYGQPAHVRQGQHHLEGESLHIDQGHQQAWIEGRGLLQLPVARGLDGKALPNPQVLDLSWQEQMTFDGEVAVFTGDTRARLGDVSVTCRRLRVGLPRRYRFDELASQDRAPEPAWGECEDHVHFESHSRTNNRLVEVQQAEAFSLRFERTTGKVLAHGPGWMKLWRRDAEPQGTLAPVQSARANAPQRLDATDWQFSQITFDGAMDGNLQQRHATFREDVRLLHGPVTHPLAVIDEDQLPPRGGRLECQELQLMQRPDPSTGKLSLEFVGQGNTQLEGQQFFALADQVSYDERKESYILRAFGQNKARCWHESTVGGPRREVVYQRMEIQHQAKTVRIDGTVGGDGSP